MIQEQELGQGNVDWVKGVLLSPTFKAAHDVSDEMRDGRGRWTSGGAVPDAAALDKAMRYWTLMGDHLLLSSIRKGTPTVEAAALLNAVKDAPATAPGLWRGIRLMPAYIDGVARPFERWVPGARLTFNLASFSESRSVGRGYATGRSNGPGYPEDVPVLFQLEAGARALDVHGVSAYKGEKEWITAGTFQVTDVSRAGRVRVIGLRQVATLSPGDEVW